MVQSNIRIVHQIDGSTTSKIYEKNKCIGHVANENLYGYDEQGYAIFICEIERDAEIIGKFREWLRSRK